MCVCIYIYIYIYFYQGLAKRNIYSHFKQKTSNLGNWMFTLSERLENQALG